MGDGPFVTPSLHPSLGDNVNGPSLVRVPDWVEQPLARYYLYFAHHRGDRIRLAVADAVAGPWRVHPPGVLPVAESTCVDHVASPDVHVDHTRREIRMYFRHVYALAMPGLLYRSRDGTSGFERGPRIFSERMRHAAVLRRGSCLHVFYSDVGDRPERILHATVDLEPDWTRWRPSPPRTLLAPERAWEGAELPLEPSARGAAPGPVRQLRDPAIFEEDGRVHLLYCVAGESGIALARLHET